ncbi:MAG: DUF123 domain-containing protein [Methanoregula sp.]|jgi:Uri superfamily endonuclease
MDKGIYCLVLKNFACTAKVGALGNIAFSAGWHCYIGSALGPGGLVRLDRHLKLAEQKDKKPKWHIDYLLTDPGFVVAYAVYAPTTEPLECRLAETLGEPGVKKFGCSDCRCPSHLLYRAREPKAEIVAAFTRLGLSPGIKTIKSRHATG